MLRAANKAIQAFLTSHLDVKLSLSEMLQHPTAEEGQTRGRSLTLKQVCRLMSGIRVFQAFNGYWKLLTVQSCGRLVTC